jgi:hypothetical protein
MVHGRIYACVVALGLCTPFVWEQEPQAAELEFTNPPSTSPGPVAPLAATNLNFNWCDVLRSEYADYVGRLRAAGCPEQHLRHIVVSDVIGYFDAQRLEQAMAADFEWWKPGAGPKLTGGSSMAEFEAQENQRLDLLRRYLGQEAAESVKLVPLSLTQDPSLTGRVLGSISLEKFAAAAEICQRSRQRILDYRTANFNQGHSSDPAEEARMRHQTRQELSHLLSPAEMDEFLVRNSHNADTLRQNLRGFDPTSEEFLSIFKVIDPIRHQMQVDYGNEAALSARQREELEKQCSQAVQAVLAPQRYQAYLQTADPLFRRAQSDAALWVLQSGTVAKLFAFYKEKDREKERINSDPALSQDQRAKALQAVAQEEQKYLAGLAEAQRTGKKP